MTENSDYKNKKLSSYLEDLADSKITPGGGSASSLTGAIGAALNLMVINFTASSAGDEVTSRELIVLKEEQLKCMEKLTSLVDEDCKVFRSLMAALKEKKDVQEEYKEAAKVPLEICREVRTSIAITNELVGIAKKTIASDIGCAASILKSAFHAASINVKINLKYIQDTDFTKEAEEELILMQNEVEGMEKEVQDSLRLKDVY